MLEEFDLAYDILIYSQHLTIAAEFVERFPRQRFVLDHLAKPPIKNGNIDAWARGIARPGCFSECILQIIGISDRGDWRHWKPAQIVPYLDVAFESFGPDRLMIGSDWPVCLVGGTRTRERHEIVKSYILQQKPECKMLCLAETRSAFGV